jgi:hypothetical protein
MGTDAKTFFSAHHDDKGRHSDITNGGISRYPNSKDGAVARGYLPKSTPKGPGMLLEGMSKSKKIYLTLSILPALHSTPLYG